ncbi:hypothetical protein SAY86_025685 [Trapa natans]|uniref:Uncharacterized protein n=1 Tax=Trapa natans TaxID=22666 RepID=A0AAN7KCA0_TRANT|nr:hypothetical protein SAY86_025685 [Trapa natans]
MGLGPGDPIGVSLSPPSPERTAPPLPFPFSDGCLRQIESELSKRAQKKKKKKKKKKKRKENSDGSCSSFESQVEYHV